MTIHKAFDCVTALTASQIMARQSNVTLECHITLNNPAKERTIELLRIPGYNGIKGNEIADEPARLGEVQPLMGLSYGHILQTD